MATRTERLAPVTLSAPGNGAAWKLPFQSEFGGVSVFVSGTFGGSTVRLQISPDGTTWAPVGGTLSAPGAISVTAAARFARIVATGGTPNISAQLLT